MIATRPNTCFCLLLLVLFTSVYSASVSVYDECPTGSGVHPDVLCIGSVGDNPSHSGDGSGCVYYKTCEVMMIIRRMPGNVTNGGGTDTANYVIKLLAKKTGRAVKVRASITEDRRYLGDVVQDKETQGYPKNMVFIQGETKRKVKGEVREDHRVWIRFSDLPTPACLNYLNSDPCAPEELSKGHFIPQPLLQDSGHHIFPFETASADIFFKPVEPYSGFDGSDVTMINIHLKTGKVVLGVEYFESNWKSANKKGTQHPDTLTRINWIETEPFLLFSSLPVFVPHERNPRSWTWVYILIAVVLIVVLLCVLFWFLWRLRDRDLDDGRVGISRGSTNSFMRSGVKSSVYGSHVPSQYDVRSSIRSSVNSNHTPHVPVHSSHKSTAKSYKPLSTSAKADQSLLANKSKSAKAKTVNLSSL